MFCSPVPMDNDSICTEHIKIFLLVLLERVLRLRLPFLDSSCMMAIVVQQSFADLDIMPNRARDDQTCI